MGGVPARRGGSGDGGGELGKEVDRRGRPAVTPGGAAVLYEVGAVEVTEAGLWIGDKGSDS